MPNTRWFVVEVRDGGTEYRAHAHEISPHVVGEVMEEHLVHKVRAMPLLNAPSVALAAGCAIESLLWGARRA